MIKNQIFKFVKSARKGVEKYPVSTTTGMAERTQTACRACSSLERVSGATRNGVLMGCPRGGLAWRASSASGRMAVADQQTRINPAHALLSRSHPELRMPNPAVVTSAWAG